MKAIISYLLSWLLYFIGDLASELYQKFMEWSVRVQDWGGVGPWQDDEDQ